MATRCCCRRELLGGGEALVQAHELQNRDAALHGLVVVHAPKIMGRVTFTQRGHDLDQLKVLEDVADLAVSEPGDLEGVELAKTTRR
jgi:hypothetical protein